MNSNIAILTDFRDIGIKNELSNVGHNPFGGVEYIMGKSELIIGEAVYEVSRLFSGEQTVSSLLESQIERMIMENTSFDEENHREV